MITNQLMIIYKHPIFPVSRSVTHHMDIRSLLTSTGLPVLIILKEVSRLFFFQMPWSEHVCTSALCEALKLAEMSLSIRKIRM